MNCLRDVLDQFAHEHSHVDVGPTLIDVHGVFRTMDGYDGPRMYADHKENIVAYTATGASLIEKFQEADTKKGYELRDDLHDDNTFKALTCFCLRPIRNTSLREVQHALQFESTDEVQGYKQRHINELEERIREYNPAFDAENDSAFIFAHDQAERRAKLNAHLLEQALTHGADAPKMVDDREARLMEALFPRCVLNGDKITEYSYMPTDDRLPSGESETYLRRKVNAYQKQR